MGAAPQPMMMEMARANEMHIVEDAMMMEASGEVTTASNTQE